MPDTLEKIQGEFLSDRLLEKKEIVITVRGHCMWPALCDGDEVLVRRVPCNTVERGDIVFYQRGSKFYCHRVLRRQNGVLMTKGDRFLSADEPIDERKIFGKVLSKKRKSGCWIDLSSPVQYFYGQAALISSLLINPFFSLVQKMKQGFMYGRRRHLAQTALMFFLRKGSSGEAIDFSKLNWHVFLQEAYQESVSAMIYARIKQEDCRELMPRWVFKKLEQDYLINTGRNILMKQDIERFAEKINEAKINAFLVRGATFLDRVYVDGGERPIMDMDIVIHDRDFRRVKDLLEAEGFSCFEEYPFFYKRGEFYVDLHLNSLQFWRLNWPTPIRITNEDLWQRTLAFDSSLVVRQLDVYDQILHCCEHLMRHNYEKLMWFMDISYIIEADDSFRWEKLYRRAEEAQFLKPLLYIFTFLEEHGLCSVYETFYRQIRQIPQNPIEKRCVRLLKMNRRKHFCGEWLAFFMIKGWSKRWQLFYYGIFIKKVRLPLVRQKFLWWSYIKRFFKLLSHQTVKAFYFIKL